MCGIAGFVDYSCKSNSKILDRMRDSLTHRGPDSEGSVVLNNEKFKIGLAHRRLSIIDLTTCGAQPMTDKSGNYSIIFNGEIYNFKEIKAELLSLGCRFRSASDTEVILESFIKWGIQTVNKFIGMFAFVIYDKINNNIILCRDRTGVKPLYYSINSKLILFGSELKSLMAHPAFEKNIDFNSVASFLRRGWIAAPYTIFQSTYKLKPGHYLEINLSNRQVKECCYWDVHDYYRMEELSISFEDAKEQLHQLLKSSCEYRMVADTEVGIFLSGGFDSSTVTAILQKDRIKKLNTFSIGFEDENFNEAPYAKAVAAHLGTNHHEMICTAKDAIELIPKLPFYYDEPFADSSAIPTMLVSKFASAKVKVCLSADGGDEVFGGYPRYYNKLEEFNKVKSIPRFLRTPLSTLVGASVHVMMSRNPHKKVRLEKLQSILLGNNLSQRFRYRSEPIHFANEEVKNLLREKNINFSLKTFYDDIQLRADIDPSMFMMALEYKTTLVDDILVKVDRATMSYSLEGREPFLDHRLVEFCARLNSKLHSRKNSAKALIKEICYDYIPKRIIDRPKKGFAIPTNKWLQADLKEIVLELTANNFIRDQNIFSVAKSRELINNYYKGFDKNGERIWFFLMFQLWYNEWMR